MTETYNCWMERQFTTGISHKCALYDKINTFKYHILFTDGKVSVRINIVLPLFSTVVPSNSGMFLSYRPFVVNTTFSTPTRPVENVVLTTKGLQDRKIQLLDRTTLENKGKTILILIK